MIWDQLLFAALLLGFGVLIAKRVHFIRRCIMQGRSFRSRVAVSRRWRNLLLVALGQQRMFSRFWPALFHLFIYVGFLLINVFLVEVICDGLWGAHRMFSELLGSFYVYMLSGVECLVVLVLCACVVFLWRRNLRKIGRLSHADLRGWPKWDANLILSIEILLMGAILYMNAADTILQQRIGGEVYPRVGAFFVSQSLIPSIDSLSTSSLQWIERSCWWFHVMGVLGFAYYVTYSKHMHIVLAFPNTYYAPLSPAGVSEPLSRVREEIRAMQEGSAPPQVDASEPLGARDVNDLSWKQLLEAFTCTECGRCTDVCPAQASGKKLSPRKIMMDTRDRATERASAPDLQKTLLFDYIQLEEINACTSCQACIEACPIQINPMDIILSLRQYVAMETDKSPSDWQRMFANVENNHAPWQFPAHSRADWSK